MNGDQIPQFRDLKTVDARKRLPENFVRLFENKLKDEYEKYYVDAYLIDQLEEHSEENAFANGFLAGCIYGQENG